MKASDTEVEKTPFFSIITVSFNAEAHIRKTIESTLEQDFADFEIIVKDGMSKDGTLGQIPEDPRIKVYSTPDSGIYNAMNQAVEYASGEYLIFMNCGDLFNTPDVLAQVHDYIINADGQKSGIVIGDCISKGLYKCQNKCTSRFKQYRCSGFAHQSMFFRRDIFEKVGYYDESYKVYADFELFMRVYAAGLGIGYLPCAICDYMGGGFSAKKETKRLLDADKKRIRKKYFSTWERLKYFTMFHATLPGIRNLLEGESTPAFLKKAYRSLTNRFNR